MIPICEKHNDPAMFTPVNNCNKCWERYGYALALKDMQRNLSKLVKSNIREVLTKLEKNVATS